MSENLCQGPAF